MKLDFQYYILAYFLGIITAGNLLSQNLVQNPSFEEIIHCPDGYDDLYGSIRVARAWYNLNFTPDLFTSCISSTGMSKVPENAFGYQTPYEGFNYAGIFLFQTPEKNVREYINNELIIPMAKEKKFCVSIFISLADYYSQLDISTFGILFSNKKPIINSDGFIDAIPQLIKGSDFPISANEWKELSGMFIAEGGERYLTIGNFASDENSDTVFVNPHTIHSIKDRICYFYIDNVSVTCCDPLGCGLMIPNSFTPNGDGYNETWQIAGLMPSTQVQVFNRWGNMVFQANSYDGTWDGDGLPDGTYYYLAQEPGGELYKGFLQILR